MLTINTIIFYFCPPDVQCLFSRGNNFYLVMCVCYIILVPAFLILIEFSFLLPFNNIQFLGWVILNLPWHFLLPPWHFPLLDVTSCGLVSLLPYVYNINNTHLSRSDTVPHFPSSSILPSQISACVTGLAYLCCQNWEHVWAFSIIIIKPSLGLSNNWL